MNSLPEPMNSVGPNTTTATEAVAASSSAFVELRPSSISLVRWLGYGGLIPFLAPLAALWFDAHHGAIYLQIQQAYGAVILSFVGALHWGIAMSRVDLAPDDVVLRFLWSVIPALIAWPALMLGGGWAAGLLAFGFLVHYLQDRILANRLRLPTWYMPMRLHLTAVAVLALLSAALINGFAVGWWLPSQGAVTT